MTKLHPTIRPGLRDDVINYLYQKDEQSAAEMLSQIIDEHVRLTGQNQLSFMFYGKVYCNQYAAKPMIAPPLHPDLEPRMKAWLLDRLAVEREEKLIVKNLITAILNTSDHPEDWMKLLPPAVHQPIADFAFYNPQLAGSTLTPEQVEAFETKQERFLNMLKGRLALNLIF